MLNKNPWYWLFSASSAPLYVVDGMPYDEESVNALNPADIESMSILKMLHLQPFMAHVQQMVL